MMNERKMFGLTWIRGLPRTGVLAARNRHVRNSGQPADGFTLVEMLVVIALIVLMAGLAVPGITQLFKSGADAQAYNLLAAQLNTARTYAMQKNCYTCLHLQVATGPASTDPQNTIGMIFVLDTTPKLAGGTINNGVVTSYGYGYFTPSPYNAATNTCDSTGFEPQTYPGHYAFGQASAAFITGNVYQPQVANNRGAQNVLNVGSLLCDFLPTETTTTVDRRKLNIASPWFTSVNIIFTPQGAITTTVPTQLLPVGYTRPRFAYKRFTPTPAPITFQPLSYMYAFYMQPMAPNRPDPNSTSTTIWEWTATANTRLDASGTIQYDGFNGVTALTMFSMTDANASYDPTKGTATSFTNFLNESGQLIPINIYTGQLFPRK